MSGKHQITRDGILGGEVEKELAEAERLGLFKRKTEEERLAVRQEMQKRLADGDIWVYGYGSLIWNPAFHFVEQRKGRIHGWHRQFCMETPLGRGSPEFPGLMLALDRGGSCTGVALRIAAEVAEHELDIVLKRELVSDAYITRIVQVHTDDGVVPAITFTMNRQSPRYVGNLGIERSAQIIARAEGWLGPCSEYLFNTVSHLRELGLSDRYLHALEKRVSEIQAA